MAPRRRRSLLRRLPRALGAALRPNTAWTRKRHQTPRPVQRAPSRCQARRPSPVPMERAPAVATLVFIVVVLGLWGGAALARADEVPPPTTTVSDAPPPDPYKAPVKTTKPKAAAPRQVAPVRRAYTAPSVRTYTPPARVTSRPAVRTAAARPKAHAKVVRKNRAKPKLHPVLRVSVAPVSHVLAATRISLPVVKDEKHPYLWLSGISFAILAVAGTGLLLLTQRTLRTEWE
jgi:hypothetical protein